MVRSTFRFLVLAFALAACGGSSATDAQLAAGGGKADSQKRCGGFAGFVCADEGDYCFYEESQSCGFADQMGSCKVRPDACAAVVGTPVCGCDGKTYADACHAAVAGISVRSQGPCGLQGEPAGE